MRKMFLDFFCFAGNFVMSDEARAAQRLSEELLAGRKFYAFYCAR